MRLLKPAFKYLNRSQTGTIVLVPGWATDYRIFNLLNLNFNYLIPLFFSPLNFTQKLLQAMKEHQLKKISLLGFSMGSFLAADFSSKFPHLVDKLILAGIRKKYPKAQLSQIKSLLKRSKKGYLSKFYSQCFYQKDKLAWFKEKLMKAYFNELKLNFLLKGLDYLEKAEFDFSGLKKLSRLKIIQGREDLIAPQTEALMVKENLPQAQLSVVKGAGHIVFLEQDIAKLI